MILPVTFYFPNPQQALFPTKRERARFVGAGLCCHQRLRIARGHPGGPYSVICSTSLAEPRLLAGGGEGLVNCLYATCSGCRNSCKPIRLQDLATSRIRRLRFFVVSDLCVCNRSKMQPVQPGINCTVRTQRVNDYGTSPKVRLEASG